jgi:hypothetical protein
MQGAATQAMRCHRRGAATKQMTAGRSSLPNILQPYERMIHAVTAFSGPVINEILTSALPAYLKEGYDFNNGKIYPNDRPGVGVVFDSGKVNLIREITQPRDVSGYLRPDGSFTSL